MKKSTMLMKFPQTKHATKKEICKCLPDFENSTRLFSKSQNMMQNAHVLATICVDTAEKEPTFAKRLNFYICFCQNRIKCACVSSLSANPAV